MTVRYCVSLQVRRHFDCDELEGAELEDQGEEGTALTHWEKRLFEVSLSSVCGYGAAVKVLGPRAAVTDSIATPSPHTCQDGQVRQYTL